MSDCEDKEKDDDTRSETSEESESPKGLKSKPKSSERKKSFTAKGISLINKIIGYQTDESQPNDSHHTDFDKESIKKSTDNNHKKKRDDSSDDESVSIPEDKPSEKHRKSEIGPKIGFVRKVLNYEEFQVSAFAPGNSADHAPMWIATWKLFDLPVVLVEVKDELFSSSFRRRIKKMRKVPAHPNVLRCFGYCTKTNGKASIVYEFVPQAPLSTHKGNLTSKEKLFIVMCIARGMWQLHRSKIFHGNLSVHNVLIDTLRNPKLTEYCLPATLQEANKKVDLAKGKPADVYDFGTLIADLFYVNLPNDTTNNTETALQSALGQAESDFPKELQYLLSLCLTQDPNERPTFYRIQNSLENYYYGTWKFATNNPLALDVLPSTLPHEEQLKQREEQILKLMMKVKALEEAISHNSNNNTNNSMNTSSADLRRLTLTKQEPSPTVEKKEPQKVVPKDISQPKSDSNDNNAQSTSPRTRDGIFGNFGNLLFNAKNIRSTLVENDFKTDDTIVKNPAQLQLEISARFRGALKIDWIDFCIILKDLLSVEQEQLDEVKYLLCDKKSKVDKAVWEHMMKWFTPLYPEMSRPDNTKAYTFSDVVDIVGQKWFFGFIDPIETNKILATKPTGTFLFRFSSQPGCYTLSVSNSGQVGHWRIRSERGADYEHFFIDEKQYTSLSNVIEVHINESLKINTAKSNQRPLRLEVPYERPQIEDDRDHIYSEF